MTRRESQPLPHFPGILIPPSIAYIVIGLVLGVSTATLFLAAIIPGVMILSIILVTNITLNRVHGFENSNVAFSWSRWVTAMWDGKFALMVPVIILGGIYSGIFTPTEAAAVAVVVTIAIGFYPGTLQLPDLSKMLISSAQVSGLLHLPLV